jgi:hypothetical protein
MQPLKTETDKQLDIDDRPMRGFPGTILAGIIVIVVGGVIKALAYVNPSRDFSWNGSEPRAFIGVGHGVLCVGLGLLALGLLLVGFGENERRISRTAAVVSSIGCALATLLLR